MRSASSECRCVVRSAAPTCARRGASSEAGWVVAMRTNIEIDDELMKKAMRASKQPTKRAVVEAALRLLVQTHKQARIRRLKGKIAWEGNLDESRASRFLPED